MDHLKQCRSCLKIFNNTFKTCDRCRYLSRIRRNKWYSENKDEINRRRREDRALRKSIVKDKQ